jgi:chromate transporter
MKTEDSPLYFWLFLRASLFSTGGFGNLPALHGDLIERGWATERQFAEALMIGQITPGPNGLWVITLGYLTDGLRGALLALLAIALPPLLILGVDSLYRRVKDHPAVEGFLRGMSLAIIGIFTVALTRILQDIGLNARTLLILVGAFALGATRRIPLFVILALGALVSILWR